MHQIATSYNITEGMIPFLLCSTLDSVFFIVQCAFFFQNHICQQFFLSSQLSNQPLETLLVLGFPLLVSTNKVTYPLHRLSYPFKELAFICTLYDCSNLILSHVFKRPKYEKRQQIWCFKQYNISQNSLVSTRGPRALTVSLVSEILR